MPTITADSTFDAAVSTYTISNGDLVTVAGGVTCTINASNLSGGPANVIPLTWSLSAYGGTLYFDGTTCRRLDYDGGATAAPAVGDTCSNGTASGEVIYVVGNTTSGHMILRSVTGGSFSDNDSLTYGSGTGLANGADRVGYIEFANRGGNAFNAGAGGIFVMRGEWYTIGAHDGTNGFTIDHPFSNWIPFILVETGNGTGQFEAWFNYAAMTDTNGGGINSAGTSGKLGNAFTNPVDSSTITFGGGANRGNVPANGALILCPNIYLSESNTGYTATQTSTSSSNQVQIRCNIDAEKFMTSGNIFASPSENIKLWDCGFNATMDLAQTTGTFDVRRLYSVRSPSSSGACTFKQLGASPTIQDVYHVTDFSTQGIAIQLCSGTTFTRLNFINGDNNGSGFEYSNIRDSSNLTFVDPVIVGGNVVFESNDGITINNLDFSSSTDGQEYTRLNEIINFRELNSNVVIDGVELLTGGAHTYGNTIGQTAGKLNNVTVKNVGSIGTLLDLNSRTDNFIEFRDADNVFIARVHILDFRSNHGIEPNNFGYQKKCKLWDCSLRKTSGNVGLPIAYVNEGIELRSVRTNYSALYTTTSVGLQTYNNTFGNYFYDGLYSDTTGRVVFFPCRESGNGHLDAYYSANVTTAKDNYQGPNTGQHQLLASGESVEWESPWYIKGHTAITGWTFSGTRNSATVEYQVDTGSGFGGSWIDFDDGTNPITSLSISASGFKLKVRVTYNGGPVTLQAIEIQTSADPTSWGNNLHSLDVFYDLTIDLNGATGILVVHDYDSADPQELGTELQRDGAASGTEVYQYASTKAGDDISINLIPSNGFKQLIKVHNLPANNSTLKLDPEVETN